MTPVPAAERSKARVYGRSLAGIAGSNHAGGMDGRPLWVLSGITRPEESYRLWCVLVCDLGTSRMRRLKLIKGCKCRIEEEWHNDRVNWPRRLISIEDCTCRWNTFMEHSVEAMLVQVPCYMRSGNSCKSHEFSGSESVKMTVQFVWRERTSYAVICQFRSRRGKRGTY